MTAHKHEDDKPVHHAKAHAKEEPKEKKAAEPLAPNVGEVRAYVATLHRYMTTQNQDAQRAVVRDAGQLIVDIVDQLAPGPVKAAAAPLSMTTCWSTLQAEAYSDTTDWPRVLAALVGVLTLAIQ